MHTADRVTSYLEQTVLGNKRSVQARICHRRLNTGISNDDVTVYDEPVRICHCRGGDTNRVPARFDVRCSYKERSPYLSKHGAMEQTVLGRSLEHSGVAALQGAWTQPGSETR
jgi:hypothetical protein